MRLSGLGICLVLAGCGESHAIDGDGGPIRVDGSPTGRDGSRPRADAGPRSADAGPCEPERVDDVDLLFVIDNSNSMSEEQASLAAQVPHLVHAMATGDVDPAVDADGDGATDDPGDDFHEIRSLHVGVVTSDMGTGGFPVMTCTDEPNFGDDGLLRTTGSGGLGCMATYPTFLSYVGGDDPGSLDVHIQCVMRVGLGGCGFEQQLEATLKAVTPASCTDPWCTFSGGTSGHADRENDGFLRPNSLLVVVTLTDEEDCSAADPDLFNSASTRYSGEPNLRCFLNPDARHPVGRYVEGLLATRRRPGRLIYAAITGVPVNGTTSTSTFDQILGRPEVQERIDPTMMTRLEPSCNVPGRGVAFPPRRIVETAAGLAAAGAVGIVESICQEDYSVGTRAILDAVGRRVRGGGCD